MRLGATVLCPLAGMGMLVACGARNADRVQPITEAQRARVLSAVHGLQQALNQNSCGSVLEGADEQLRKDWIEQCDYIRQTWGNWQTFGAKYWYRAGPAAVAVAGISGFAKGNCTVQLVWSLEPAPAYDGLFLAI